MKPTSPHRSWPCSTLSANQRASLASLYESSWPQLTNSHPFLGLIILSFTPYIDCEKRDWCFFARSSYLAASFLFYGNVVGSVLSGQLLSVRVTAIWLADKGLCCLDLTWFNLSQTNRCCLYCVCFPKYNNLTFKSNKNQYNPDLINEFIVSHSAVFELAIGIFPLQSMWSSADCI